MTDSLVRSIVDTFGSGNTKELVVFVISMIPILELRGSILAAGLMNMNFLSAYIISVLGNIIPVPFILLFIDKIFALMKKTRLKGFVEKLERKALSKSDQIKRYGSLGLYLFVAVPLPGTGAWTGALIASMLRLEKKRCILFIFLGILTAGLIMSIISFGALKNILY
ncbi:MAG: small multi-drug export protein [Oscillospiraceae bacterium]|nr:small multi-drug export protein [Oscillospiraceae bacterium]